MGWIARLFPGPAILTKIAVYGLIFALGGAMGSAWTTQRAMDRREREGNQRMVEYHGQIVTYYAERMKEIRRAREQQTAADKAAYAVLEQGKAQSDQAADRARASLRIALGEKQKLEMTNEGLKAVAEIQATEARKRPPDPGCSMPPGVRQSIDTYIASLNASPNVGGPEASAPGASSRSAGEDPPLTCVELADSVIDILQVAGGYISRDASWRSWVSEALR